MKTIKQVSESISVSKVSIYRAIKKDEMKPFIFKDKDNITLVNEDGEKLLISIFNHEKAETVDDIAETFLTDANENENPANEDEKLVIAILQQELKQRNEEIKSLLNIITSQQDISINQQKLQVTKYLTNNQDTADNKESTAQASTKPRKGFFSRQFKKRQKSQAENNQLDL